VKRMVSKKIRPKVENLFQTGAPAASSASSSTATATATLDKT
jgi:hypothetical protein